MFRAENDMHQIEAQRLRHLTDYMSGLQPSAVLADTYLGLRPRLVCRRAFGPYRLSIQPAGNQPRTQQPTSPGQWPWNQAARTRPGTKPRHILSAKGAKHTSLGQRPRYAGTDNQRGLKARHIASPFGRATTTTAAKGL
jgi:hypothetical protein